jgi:branched-subunit amino acid aminotransferase/4-amino-4-deoxychorismate lyase
VIWVDGALRPAGAGAVRGDDSAYAEGRGCYTSVRIRAGAPQLAERHVQRLVRDARALGLPPPDPALLHRALRDLARAAFAGGEGVVRLSLSRDGGGALHAVGVPRALGDDRPTWRAVTAPLPHPGPLGPRGAKLTNRLALALAADAARAAGAEEALLFDARGYLVEGARTNILALARDGALCAPPDDRGAVAGVALEVACARLPELRRRDLSRRDLFAARGVAALNAVRGARALVALDGKPLGDGGEALAAGITAALDERVP